MRSYFKMDKLHVFSMICLCTTYLLCESPHYLLLLFVGSRNAVIIHRMKKCMALILLLLYTSLTLAHFFTVIQSLDI